MSPPRPARGFTLLEVLVAMVVASIVASLAYQLLATATTTGERIAEAERALGREAGFRALLEEALRHLAPASGVDTPPFRVSRTADGDALAFDSYGVAPPAGASARWHVRLWADEAGLHLEAVPADGDVPPVRMTLPGGHDLEILTRTSRSREWTAGPEEARGAPASVTIRWAGAEGSGVPLVVHTSLERIQ